MFASVMCCVLSLSSCAYLLIMFRNWQKSLWARGASRGLLYGKTVFKVLIVTVTSVDITVQVLLLKFARESACIVCQQCTNRSLLEIRNDRSVTKVMFWFRCSSCVVALTCHLPCVWCAQLHTVMRSWRIGTYQLKMKLCRWVVNLIIPVQNLVCVINSVSGSTDGPIRPCMYSSRPCCSFVSTFFCDCPSS